MRWLIAVIVFSGCIVDACPAERIPERYWPRWRGPNDTGSTSRGVYPASWNKPEQIEWKLKLPGIGCSTPAVWGDNILLTGPIDGEDALMNIDWSGKVRWQVKFGKERAGKHRNGSGSNPSPVTDGKQIFAYFKTKTLVALDFDGKVQWKKSLARFAKDTLYWDLGTSPVLTSNAVVVAVMHKGESFLVAYNKADGSQKWKVARNYETPVEGDHSYATPIVVSNGKTETIVVWGAEHLTAHDATDGRVLWSCGGFNPEKKRNWVAVASSVITNGVAIVPYGRGTHVAGIRLGGEGDVTRSNRLWTRTDTGSFVPTPAAAGDRVFFVRDKGEVECLSSKTGKTIWKGAFPKHRAKYYASPVVAAGKLYAPREDGVVLVASIADGFEFLSENDMGERVIASPVPVDDRLLIRGEQNLFCIKP